VKEKIAQEKGWEASQQKLIYSGVYSTFLDETLLVFVYFLPLEIRYNLTLTN
jgi:hypothetical protein